MLHWLSLPLIRRGTCCGKNWSNGQFVGDAFASRLWVSRLSEGYRNKKKISNKVICKIPRYEEFFKCASLYNCAIFLNRKWFRRPYDPLLHCDIFPHLSKEVSAYGCMIPLNKLRYRISQDSHSVYFRVIDRKQSRLPNSPYFCNDTVLDFEQSVVVFLQLSS